MNIEIDITNKHATAADAPVIVCGNSDYTINFAFDDEWAAFDTKTARFVFVRDGVTKHIDVVFSGYTVAVPVLVDILEVRVGVFADELCTTTPARIPCERSILCNSGEGEEPTPNQYSRIMHEINLIKQRLDQVERQIS